jgi:hypothetical protein
MNAFSCRQKLFQYQGHVLRALQCNIYLPTKRNIDAVLKPLLGRCALVSLDDVIVYSKDLSQHLIGVATSCRSSVERPGRVAGQVRVLPDVDQLPWPRRVGQGPAAQPAKGQLYPELATTRMNP